VNQAATVLSRNPATVIGEGRLWKLLDSWQWTYRAADGCRRPYQAQVDTGRLASKAQSHHHPRTGELVLDPPQVRVTAKGLEEIHRRLAERVLSVVPA
jgi:phage antirepressor YoqD-like protein